MKERKHNHDIGATPECTLCLLKGSFDDGLPHGVKADAWFGPVRTAFSVAAKGREEYFKLNKIRACFQKKT